MKNFILFLAFFLMTFYGHSQIKTFSYEVTIKQLKEAKKLSDLAKDVASTCEVKQCFYSMVNAGKITEFTINGHFLAIHENANRLEKIIITKIVSDCKELSNNKYIFTVKNDK